MADKQTTFKHHQAEQAALRAAIQEARDLLDPEAKAKRIADEAIQKARDASYGWPVLKGDVL